MEDLITAAPGTARSNLDVYVGRMQFNVLGPLEAVADDQRFSLGGLKQRTVLAVLIAHAGATVSADRLIESTWGEDAPDGARRSLQTYISNLRGVLGEVITREGPGYRLDTDRPAVDAMWFEDEVLAAQAMDDEPEAAADRLRTALAAWRGHPYDDVDGGPELDAEITRLDELRMAALEARIDADLAAGHHRRLVGELDALTEEYPLRERFRAQQMVALFRSGRQAEALRAYQKTRTYLGDELGIDPTPELRDLELRILDQDDSLLAPGAKSIVRRAVLIADIDGLAEYSPEDRQRLVDAYGAALETAAEQADGTVFAHRGSATYAMFETAVLAVAAAETTQRRLAATQADGPGLRIAIDVGDVESVADADAEVTGPPISRSRGLAAAAWGGQVLLSPDAQADLSRSREGGWQVKALGSHPIQGLGEEMVVYQLVVSGLSGKFPALRTDGIAPGLPGGASGLPGYELREVVGRGSFGVVHRAYQPSVGREVAVKVIRPDLANEPEFIRRFEVEAQLVARLEHPHIVPLYDYWRDPDGAYLVMRWIRGGTLAVHLREQGVMSLDVAADLVTQLAPALDVAHRAGVIHRDLKPSNVLLDEDGNAYLSDFGIASDVVAELAASNEPADSRTDVAGLGALLRQALGNDVADPIDAVLETATAPAARGRYATVADFVAAWEVALAQQGLDAAPATFTPTRNPYKGLASFQETDAVDFHGRDDVIEALVDAVARNRLIAVVGPSGIGKSSAVRAGLIPALREGAVAGSASWLITDMIPGAYPFESLASALLRIADRYPVGLDEELRADRRGLVRVASRLLPEGSEGLLVIDQFEELFTLAAEPDTADRFLHALTDLINDPAANVRVLLTLRADFFDRPLRHAEFGELLRAATVPVSSPTGDDLTAIVQRPAEHVGVEFEPGLVQRIVRDIAGQPAALPLLEFALTELFAERTSDMLTVRSYEAEGGVLGALAHRAAGVFAGFDDPAREATRQVMLRLVSVSEASDATRRRVRRSELDRLDVSSATVDAVLAEFGAARLVAFDHDPATRGPTVEITHESLFTEWERLAGWIGSRREDLVLNRRLSAAVDDWDTADRDDAYLVGGGRLSQFEAWAESTDLLLTSTESDFLKASREAEDARVATRRRRRALVMGGFGIAVAIALVLAVTALVARNDAAEQALVATQAAEQAELATLISRSAEASDDLPAVSILLALEAHRRAPGPDTERAVLNALSRSTLGTRVATFDLSGSDWWLSGDEMSLSVSSIDSRMTRLSLVTGDSVDVGVLPQPDATWVGDQATGRRFAYSLDTARFWFGFDDGPWVQVDPDEPMQLLNGETLGANRLVLQTQLGTYIGDGIWSYSGEPLVRVVLLDATTGEPVGVPIEGMVQPRAVLSEDNRLIAVSSRESSVFGGAGAVFVLDAQSGDELFHVEIPGGVHGIVFDTAAGELIAGTGDGRLITLDLVDQDVVAEVDTNASAEIVDVDIRQDGSILVVSPGRADLVDRRAGPIPGSGIELRDVFGASVRADDTLLVFSGNNQIEVHDFDGGALVEESYDAGGAFHVDLGPGPSAVANVGGSLERINLSTGDRTTDLVVPEDFDLGLHFAEPTGGVALSDDMEIALWEGGRLTERLFAASEPGVEGMNSTHTSRREAMVGLRADGTEEVILVNTEPGELGVVLTVHEVGAMTAYPAPGDGLFVMLADGRLLTYDASGSMISEIPTGLSNPTWAVWDEASGKLAFGAFLNGFGGVVVVDPATREVNVLPDVEEVANLRFVRNGELLVVVSLDGTVRLWGVEREEFTGVIWDGTGANPGNALTYDEATDSLWVFSAGNLLRLPLDPQRWVERACELAGRDLTEDEWDRYVPGDGPLQSSCG